MPDPAEQLQRIYLAGFELQTFDRFPKCVGVVRDGCIASARAFGGWAANAGNTGLANGGSHWSAD